MRALLIPAAILVFVAIATLNSGGYRYGASDQAFYIPAIADQLDPALFPRDTALIGPQARYFLVDEIAAAAIRATGWPVETWFGIGYIVSLLLLGLALWAFGDTIYRTPLAACAFLAAEALRHRITRTGVNTLEGYFHPRVLVFAVGVGAIAAYLRGHPWLGLAGIVLAGLLHPTTAAFFVVFLAVAIWTTEPRARLAVGLAAVAGTAGAAWLLLAGPMRETLAPMDPAWQSLLAAKDYLFPTRDWSAADWLANLGTAAIAIGGLAYRVRHGIGNARERGLLAGAVALLAGFLITLPAVAAGSAFFVQLQISRVFWILDLLAVAVVVALVVDERKAHPARGRLTWRHAVAAALVVMALARGLWATLVEHAERDVIAWTLPDGAWTRVIEWAEQQPARAHFLADPGHAWRFGSPLRYAGRDVFLEEVKDTAMAIYSRDSAARVIARQRALGDFAALDAGGARRLAAQYGLDYLVIDRDLNLPLAHREGPFRIYRLRPVSP